MIKVCIFDMGGVMIRNYSVGPSLLEFLGFEQKSFGEVDPALAEALRLHSMGCISEDEFWKKYVDITHRSLPSCRGSLLGKFFNPTLDDPTVSVVQHLKGNGIRVVCGTNVIDSHYKIHQDLHQYDVFDHVYPSHLMGIAKPDESFYTYICEKEGVNVDQVFFTDDLLVNVDAARAVGLHGYQYTDAQTLAKELRLLGLPI